MFTLRPEQLQAFAQHAKDTFVNQMLTQLRQHFPTQTADLKDDALTTLIHQGIDAASQYSLKS